MSALTASTLVLGGCNEYWWSRGQAVAPSELSERASRRLDEALSAKRFERDDISKFAQEIQDALSGLRRIPAAKQSLLEDLRRAEGPMRALEGRLSYGSRPAYGELCGQLRSLKTIVEDSPADMLAENEVSSLNLFAARTLFFLADELSVPAPVSPASIAG